MKTFLVIVITVAVTWIMANFVHGAQTGTERLWLISAVKAPGRLALGEIQADMNAGRYQLAKAKMDVFVATWRKFDSGPDSLSGPGIGNIMLAFTKMETNRVVQTPNGR